MPARGRPRAFDRDAALEKAMYVFWERGYQAASMADLTAAMGIGSPSLYAAFGSKETLFKETVALYEATEGAGPTDALHHEPTARAAVETMLRRSAAAYAEPGKPAGCFIVLAAPHCTTDTAGAHLFLAERRRRTLATLQQRIAQGIADGDVPAGADPHRAAQFYNTVHYGLSIQARDGATCTELQEIVDAAMAAWDGLAAPGENGQSRT